MNYLELKEGDSIAFYISIYGDDEKKVYSGEIIYINYIDKLVCVSYYESYHTRMDIVPFDKIMEKVWYEWYYIIE